MKCAKTYDIVYAAPPPWRYHGKYSTNIDNEWMDSKMNIKPETVQIGDRTTVFSPTYGEVIWEAIGIIDYVMLSLCNGFFEWLDTYHPIKFFGAVWIIPITNTKSIVAVPVLDTNKDWDREHYIKTQRRDRRNNEPKTLPIGVKRNTVMKWQKVLRKFQEDAEKRIARKRKERQSRRSNNV